MVKLITRSFITEVHLWQDQVEEAPEAADLVAVPVVEEAPAAADLAEDHVAASAEVTDPEALAVITDPTIITTIVTDPSSLDGTDPSLATDTEAAASAE